MYRKAFGLKERPFEITPDPRFVYLSEVHLEALAHLKYAVHQGKGFSVITGEAGTGKTTLVHMLLNEMNVRVRSSYIFTPILGQEDFLNYVCRDLGISSDGLKSRGENLKALHEFLLDCFARNEKVFLIVDEAQSLAPEILQEIRLLTNLETTKNKLLHVILLGQPELNDILMEPRFKPLKQRIAVRFHLEPLGLRETYAYIDYRLKRAGSRKLSIFSDAAVRAIHAYSQGIPRLINTVCDNALLEGFALNTNRIGKNIIHVVIKNLEGRTKKKKKRLWPIFLILILILILLFLSLGIFVYNIDFMEIIRYGKNV
jgi:general secretion pathway protein A